MLCIGRTLAQFCKNKGVIFPLCLVQNFKNSLRSISSHPKHWPPKSEISLSIFNNSCFNGGRSFGSFMLLIEGFMFLGTSDSHEENLFVKYSSSLNKIFSDESKSSYSTRDFSLKSKISEFTRSAAF